jgi:hypothetical protein
MFSPLESIALRDGRVLRPPQGDGDGGRRYFTPSFFCRLVDEVVYWKISFLSG